MNDNYTPDLAESGPAQKPDGLYDIERFFENGLGLSVEEVRAYIDLVKAGFRSMEIERGQHMNIEVPAGTLIDLVEMADRLVAMWEDDTHVSVVAHRFADFSIEHSIKCRAQAQRDGRSMADCPYHRAASKRDRVRGMPIGRNKLGFGADGHLTFERLEYA